MYEFFPGKHALVAAVVEDMVEGVVAELTVSLDEALAHGADPIAQWIDRMFAVVTRRKRLVSVPVQEVPFFWQVPAVHQARARLHALSVRARPLHGSGSSYPYLEAMTHMMPVMIANAAIDSVLRPPPELSAEALEQALIDAVRRLLGQ